jgi:CBS domain containing-hemolysin-like protein
VAKDIMIPRIDMTTVDINSTYDEVMEIFRESMYSRIPVYEDEVDNIVGIIIVKDFLLVNDKDIFHIKDIMREGYYTYEYKKTADLLIEMRLITTNVAIVLNEYGATVGMITVEDLLEEIVGEIRDEFDEDEDELLKNLGDDEYEVAGSMKLDDINEMVGTSFTSEDYDSIGGIIIELLDRFPTEGESVTTDDNITLTAKKVDNNRIETVVIKKHGD